MWQFENWVFNDKTGVLSRQDKRIKLEPQLTRTLLYFLRSNGEIIANDEFRHALWPDRIVTDNSLYRNIATLRKTLGEDKHHPQFIANIPKVGYRWICESQYIENGKSDSTDEPVPAQQIIRAKPVLTFAIGVISCSLVLTLMWLMSLRNPSTKISFCVDPGDHPNAISFARTLNQAAQTPGVTLSALRPTEGRTCMQAFFPGMNTTGNPVIIASPLLNHYLLYGIAEDSNRFAFITGVNLQDFNKSQVQDLTKSLMTVGFSDDRPEAPLPPLEARQQYLALEQRAHVVVTVTRQQLNERLANDYRNLIHKYPEYASVYGSFAEVLTNVALRKPKRASEAYVNQAIDILKQGSQRDPNNGTILSAIGFLYRLASDYDNATLLQHKAIQAHPNDPHPYLRLSEIPTYQEGGTDEEILYLSLAYKLAPRHGDVAFYAIRAAAHAERHTMLKEISIDVVQDESAQLSTLKAVAEHNIDYLEHLDLAITATERVLAMQPYDADGLFYAYQLLVRLTGQTEPASALLEEIVQTTNFYVLHSISMAQLVDEYWSQPQRAMAILDFAQRLLDDWDIPEIAYKPRKLYLDIRRAKTLLSLGRFEEAYKLLTAAEENIPFQDDMYVRAEILTHKMHISKKRENISGYEESKRQFLKLIDNASEQELSGALLPVASYYQVIGDRQTAKLYTMRHLQKGVIDVLSLEKHVILSDLVTDEDIQAELTRIHRQINKLEPQMVGLRITIQQLLDELGETPLEFVFEED